MTIFQSHHSGVFNMHTLRLIVSVIFTAPGFLVAIFISLLAGLFKAIGLKKFGDGWQRVWIRIAIWFIFFGFNAKLIVKGKENLPKRGEKAVFIGNHQSIMDIPAVFGSGVWGGVIGKIELKKVPILNWVMMELGCVFIDRKNIRESMKAILKGTDQVKNGRPMLIFPEGTRSKTREFLEFKAGSFKMATRAKAVIHPIAIQNTRVMFENAHTFRRIPVYVSMLPPVDTSAMDEDEIKNVHSVVENMIREEYGKLPRVN